MRALGATLALAAILAAPARGQAPALRVEAPESLRGEARRLEALPPGVLVRTVDLVGGPSGGPPIRVVLLPESAAIAKAAPAWVAGFAEGAGTVVLFPGRVPRYPDTSLEELLLHELAHVLVDRAAGERAVPRWFHEGLALVAGGPWDLRDRSRLTLAMLREGEVTLAELDRRFADPGALPGAYAVAGALMRDLLRRHGTDSAARLLAEVRRGTSFASAFEHTIGVEPEAAARSFWRRHVLWYRWLPVLTSSATLWIGVTLLALAAIRRRRRRDADRMAQWEVEIPATHDRPRDAQG